ncbi:MAG: hypothetical protein Q9162_004277 [Coniocarpon cinnabarinum]
MDEPLSHGNQYEDFTSNKSHGLTAGNKSIGHEENFSGDKIDIRMASEEPGKSAEPAENRSTRDGNVQINVTNPVFIQVPTNAGSASSPSERPNTRSTAPLRFGCHRLPTTTSGDDDQQQGQVSSPAHPSHAHSSAPKRISARRFRERLSSFAEKASEYGRKAKEKLRHKLGTLSKRSRSATTSQSPAHVPVANRRHALESTNAVSLDDQIPMNLSDPDRHHTFISSTEHEVGGTGAWAGPTTTYGQPTTIPDDVE